MGYPQQNMYLQQHQQAAQEKRRLDPNNMPSPVSIALRCSWLFNTLIAKDALFFFFF